MNCQILCPFVTIYLLVCLTVLRRFGSAMIHVDEEEISDGHTVKLAVILPFSGDHPWSIPRAGEAIMYAVETVRRRSDLLPGRNIKVTFKDSHCSETLAPLAAMDLYWRREAHVFVGPACDYAVAPIARFAPYWNIPVITGGAMVRAFSSKLHYPLLTRISGSYAKLGEMVAAVLNQFGWVVPGLLYHNNLGPRQLKGKSDCYFVTEGVFVALQAPFKRLYGDKDIHTRAIDEEASDFRAQVTASVIELASKARSRWFTFVIQYYK